jgi:5-methylcytosine-specific restriction enzyme A
MALEKLPNKTYPALGLSILDRAVKKSFLRRGTKEDIESIKTYFKKNGGLRCIYCDCKKPNRWDHLHPVSQGGETVKGNLAPACARCDDSKQDKTLTEWFNSDSTHRPSKDKQATIKTAVRDYQRCFGYIPKEFEQKLNSADKVRYERFRNSWKKLLTVLKNEGFISK